MPGRGRAAADDPTQVLPGRALGGRDPAGDPAPTRILPRVPPGRPARRQGRPGRRRWPRRLLAGLAALLGLVLLLGVAGYLWVDRGLRRVDALPEYAGRPAAGAGTNWLIVGSDSRAGTPQEANVRGQRADTIMLLHVSADGRSRTLVSLPRDSYVAIPASGATRAQRNKLNAAYALGGGPLLARTVETATGLRIQRYVEVGFEGFVRIVDAAGGVRLCLDAPLRDRDSGANFPAGCTQAGGDQALAYVRARKADPLGDLGRVQRQQRFLAALVDRATSPGVLLNPPRLVAVGNATLAAVQVDRGMGPLDLASFALEMRALARGGGVATTVPVANPGYAVPGVGSTVLWDGAGAARLFGELRADRPVPAPGTR